MTVSLTTFIVPSPRQSQSAVSVTRPVRAPNVIEAHDGVAPTGNENDAAPSMSTAVSESGSVVAGSSAPVASQHFQLAGSARSVTSPPPIQCAVAALPASAAAKELRLSVESCTQPVRVSVAPCVKSPLDSSSFE